MNKKVKVEGEGEERSVPLAHFPSGADGVEPAPKKQSEVEKLNEILYERLGEIARFASSKRVECDAKVLEDEAAETNIKLLGAFSELRKMCDFYKPRENPIDPSAKEMKYKAAKQEAFNRRTWSFCDGLFPIIHIDTQEGFMARCKINGRTFRESVTQEDGADGPVWTGYVYDKGACVCMIGSMGKGKNATKLMTHAAFMAYVKQLSGCGKKYHNRKGFLRQNAARAKAAKEGK